MINKYFYLVIPTCCGEIMDDPYLYTSNEVLTRSELYERIFGRYKEITVYRIDTQTFELLEVEWF